MKASIFHSNEHTNIIISEPDVTPEECRENLKHIRTAITGTSLYLNSRKNNKVINTTPYDIYMYSSEQTLPRHMRTKLVQPRAKKSPLNTKTYIKLINFFTVAKYQHNTTQHHLSMEKAFRSRRVTARVGI